MKYYATYDNLGNLLGIETGNGQIEITKEEYEKLFANILERAQLVEQVYNGIITINDVPEKWREEIQRRVDKKKEQEDENIKFMISDTEALNIITGGEKI